MSRRKQTNPRAIKRDASCEHDEKSIVTTKKLAVQTPSESEVVDPTSLVSSTVTDDEPREATIKCDSCQATFLTSEQFNQHRLYHCSFLPEENASDESRTSSSMDEYAQQVDTIPYGMAQTEEYPHACSYCDKSFSNMALLLKHEQVHVELMPFRCSFCGKGFKHRRSLNRHSKLHTGERKFKCTLCESTFARSDHLKAHIRTHNNSNNNHHHHHHHSNSNIKTIDKTNQIDFSLKIPVNSRSDPKQRRISLEINNHKDDAQTEQCPFCPRICLGADSLKCHLQTDHQQSSEENTQKITMNGSSSKISDNYCYLCNAKFNTRENYFAHLRCTHGSIRTPKSDSISLIVHASKKPPENQFFEYALIEKTMWCEKCKRAFDSLNTYLQHYSMQHCLQMIKCLQCHDIFESIDTFFSHIEKFHPSKTVETLKCKLCNATYKNRTDFLHHIQNSHKLFTPSSSSHTLQFNSGIELIDHLKLLQKIEANDSHRQSSFNTLFSCSFCPLKLNSRFELNHHILHDHDDQIQEKKNSMVTAAAQWLCSNCDQGFNSESLLLDHQKQVHRSSPLSGNNPLVSPTFQCSYCQTSFTSRTQLDRHSRIHIAASGTNLKCNICDRLFTTIDGLSEHKLSHCKATTSNICSYCHETLQNENDYTRHLYEHNQQQTKNKTKLFNNHQEGQPVTITCIVCKQSLINEREVELHAKFHLTNELPKKSTINITCHHCNRFSAKSREFFIDLHDFNFLCFSCVRKELKISGSSEVDDDKNDGLASIPCPKCGTDYQFESVTTFQQHFQSIHSNDRSTDEYYCLQCREIVPCLEHIAQHCRGQTFSLTGLSGFLIDQIHLSSNSSLSTTRCSSPPRVNYCYLCRTNFSNPTQLHLHLIEHQYPNHDYHCNLCDNQTFNDADQLYQHTIQHGSKARLYPCRECDVFFMFSMHLINHQYSHTDATVLPLSSFKSIGTTTTSNKDKIQSTMITDEDELPCKSFIQRSSTNKGNNRSVTVN